MSAETFGQCVSRVTCRRMRNSMSGSPAATAALKGCKNSSVHVALHIAVGYTLSLLLNDLLNLVECCRRLQYEYEQSGSRRPLLIGSVVVKCTFTVKKREKHASV